MGSGKAGREWSDREVEEVEGLMTDVLVLVDEEHNRNLEAVAVRVVDDLKVELNILVIKKE